MKTDAKRLNFNISPEQEDEIEILRERMDASTTKEAILRAIRLGNLLAEQSGLGKKLVLVDSDGKEETILFSEFPPRPESEYRFLAPRAHGASRQLYVKGRRIAASAIWGDAIANGLSRTEVASSWEVSSELVDEVFRYCESNGDLIAREAEVDRERIGELSLRPGAKTAS